MTVDEGGSVGGPSDPRAQRRDDLGGGDREGPARHAPRGRRQEADAHRRGRRLRGAPPRRAWTCSSATRAASSCRSTTSSATTRSSATSSSATSRAPRTPPTGSPAPPGGSASAWAPPARAPRTSSPGSRRPSSTPIPMVAITGNVAAALLGKDAFQEIDITGITLPMTKHNYLVRDADELPRVFAEAFHIARTGRPGPVHIDITKDALQQETRAEHPTEEEVLAGLPGFRPTLDGHPRQLKLVAQEIANAKRPLILAGHGILIAEAWDELRELAEKAQHPGRVDAPGDRRHRRDASARVRLHGDARLEAREPRDPVAPTSSSRSGCGSTTGSPATCARTRRTHGSSTWTSTRPRSARTSRSTSPSWATRGASSARSSRSSRPSTARRGRATSSSSQSGDATRRPRAGTARARGATASCRPTTSSTRSARRTTTTPRSSPTSARTRCGRRATRGYRRPHSHISSGGLGTMGYAVPTAMGAALGRPDKTTWAICGDGGFQMTIQELATLVQDRIPVKIALLDNHKLGMIRQWQEIFYDEQLPLVRHGRSRLPQALPRPTGSRRGRRRRPRRSGPRSTRRTPWTAPRSSGSRSRASRTSSRSCRPARACRTSSRTGERSE